MKRWLVIGVASFVGYVIGVVTLFLWSGYQLYEGIFGHDD